MHSHDRDSRRLYLTVLWVSDVRVSQYLEKPYRVSIEVYPEGQTVQRPVSLPADVLERSLSISFGESLSRRTDAALLENGLSDAQLALVRAGRAKIVRASVPAEVPIRKRTRPRVLVAVTA